MKFKTMAACALATIGTAASAQTYVGVGLGSARACINYGVQGDCTGSATAGKLLLGYALPGTDFAIETAYTHMGSFKGSTTLSSVEAKVDMLGLGGAWRPQFGAGWGGVLRAGLDFGRVRSEYADDPSGPSGPTFHGSSSNGYWQPYIGVGATYAITPNVRLEADLEATRLKPSSMPTNVHTLMVGATFGF